MSNPTFSIVTSFNKRIYENKCQDIFECMKDEYPQIPFHAYHENRYEKKKFDRQITFPHSWKNLILHDLSEVQPRMEEFIYGAGNPFEKATGYWNTNAKFWVRKVFAIQHCIHVCKTDYMIWVDADAKFKKSLDEEFLTWLSGYDVAFIKRFWALANDAVETGFICFKVTDRTKKFADDFLNYYLSKEFTQQFRWDDSHGFTVMAQKAENQDVAQGLFANAHLEEDFNNKSPFDIYDYIHHHKGPLVSVRSQE